MAAKRGSGSPHSHAAIKVKQIGFLLCDKAQDTWRSSAPVLTLHSSPKVLGALGVLMLDSASIQLIPVVPCKAVAEVSIIGNL